MEAPIRKPKLPGKEPRSNMFSDLVGLATNEFRFSSPHAVQQGDQWSGGSALPASLENIFVDVAAVRPSME